MTEDQIERHVERAIDALDKRYVAGELTAEQYGADVATIDKWACEQYAHAKRYHVRAV